MSPRVLGRRVLFALLLGAVMLPQALFDAAVFALPWWLILEVIAWLRARRVSQPA